MKKRAMTTEAARAKKLRGHEVEALFAKIIGGVVYQASQKDKADVTDKDQRRHSVKSGKYWQVFLYGKTRLARNTIFQAIGQVAPLMVECIDAFPEKREDYVRDKHAAKTRLQKPMRLLAEELRKPQILKAFISKSLFNAGEVDYLSILRIGGDLPFHVFTQKDVVDVLSENLSVENSQKRGDSQYAEQKVIFQWRGKNVGELELRNDSETHYREMKCRFHAGPITDLLAEEIPAFETRLEGKIRVYGQSVQLFKFVKSSI